MLPRTDTGLTRVELVVLLGTILALVFVLNPPQLGWGENPKGRMIHTLSNLKQLQLATHQMALDGESTGNPNRGWPGDTGGSFTNWARALVPEYLDTNDLAKFLSAPGKITPAEKLPTANDNAVLVYAVRTNSTLDTVFLSTANFINSPTGGTLNTNALPYGKKVSSFSIATVPEQLSSHAKPAAPTPSAATLPSVTRTRLT